MSRLIFAENSSAMIDFSQSPNPLFDDIDALYQASVNSEFQEYRLSHCTDVCMRLAEFFESSQQQAIVLAWLLRRYFYNEELSTIELISHIGLRPSSIIHIHELLKDLVAKDWVKPSEDIRFNPFTTYKINSKFVQTVVSGDYIHLRPKRIRIIFDLLEEIGVLLSLRKSCDLTYEQLKVKCKKLVYSHKRFEICQFLKDVKMSETELLIFLTLCYKHYTGCEIFTVECIFSDFNPDKKEQFFIRHQFKSGKGILFDLQLIDKAPHGHFFMENDEYRLSDIATQKFIPFQAPAPKQTSIRLLEKKTPSQIKQISLFYEEAVENQINRIAQLLEANNFSAFCKRMKDRGMKSGLSILLYGASGTGKTETVYQLAHNSGRTILMVDASTIRSKWVGETEKNIRKIFREYKRAFLEFPLAPILLFNEADSIIGRRRDANDRVEQMENALQNILLQELEDFEGIFMATTNLEKNIDQAFDRRILYKMCFTPPTDEMRLSIWKSKLPEVDPVILSEINQRFKLTGGQIENIRKKIEVDSVLNIEMSTDYAYLENLSSQELMMRGNNQRNPVGFLQPH